MHDPSSQTLAVEALAMAAGQSALVWHGIP
jgi:hypothetical protein